jgi:hypothetical protein
LDGHFIDEATIDEATIDEATRRERSFRASNYARRFLDTRLVGAIKPLLATFFLNASVAFTERWVYRITQHDDSWVDLADVAPRPAARGSACRVVARRASACRSADSAAKAGAAEVLRRKIAAVRAAQDHRTTEQPGGEDSTQNHGLFSLIAAAWLVNGRHVTTAT